MVRQMRGEVRRLHVRNVEGKTRVEGFMRKSQLLLPGIIDHTYALEHEVGGKTEVRLAVCEATVKP